MRRGLLRLWLAATVVCPFLLVLLVLWGDPKYMSDGHFWFGLFILTGGTSVSVLVILQLSFWVWDGFRKESTQ